MATKFKMVNAAAVIQPSKVSHVIISSNICGKGAKTITLNFLTEDGWSHLKIKLIIGVDRNIQEEINDIIKNHYPFFLVSDRSLYVIAWINFINSPTTPIIIGPIRSPVIFFTEMLTS